MKPNTAAAPSTDSRRGTKSTEPVAGGAVLSALAVLCDGKESYGGFGQKDLLVRATGRFYTHPLIGHHLASAVVNSIASWDKLELRLIDPFCGDGRLICWFLEEVAKRSGRLRRWEVHLWDCDPQAVEAAKLNVASTAQQIGESVEIIAEVCNSFERAPDYFGVFDVCVTNPPWEVLKPDSRELNSLSEQEKDEYIRLLKVQDQHLAVAYPKSKPVRKFSGWGTNLARCGTEAALRLCSKDGICGIVSPASLLADQMSGPLRQWIFEEHHLEDLAYYAAEARLFEGVDQPCITMVAGPGAQSQTPPIIAAYNMAHKRTDLALNAEDWAGIAAEGYVFPIQFGISLLKLRSKWNSLPRFGNLESSEDTGLWAGRELDETGYIEYLSSEGQYLFTKGRNIKRFGLAVQPDKYVKADGPAIPKTADFHRLVWRDVARPTQKRRVHAAIIPPGYVTGNSLNVAYFRNADIVRLKALLGVMNSLVFEAQARMYLATAHVSLGAIRQVRLPELIDKEVVSNIAALVDACESGDTYAEVALEVTVAQLYGLTAQDFKLVCSTFEKLGADEIEAFLTHPQWQTKKARSRKALK